MDNRGRRDAAAKPLPMAATWPAPKGNQVLKIEHGYATYYIRGANERLTIAGEYGTNLSSEPVAMSMATYSLATGGRPSRPMLINQVNSDPMYPLFLGCAIKNNFRRCQDCHGCGRRSCHTLSITMRATTLPFDVCIGCNSIMPPLAH